MMSSRSCHVRPLASRFTHCVHAYAAVDAWDREGKRLLYAGFDNERDSSIVVRDIASGEERVVATTTRFDFHTATSQRWAWDDRAVVFQSQMPYGRSCPGIVQIESPGKVHWFESLGGRSIRHVMDHGEIALGTGPDTVEWMDLRDGTTEVLLTSQQAVEALPNELHDATATWSFRHPVPNRDLSMFFCKLMKTTAEGKTRFCAFFVAEPATGAVRCFGNRISGHPVWMNDDHPILNVKSPRDGTDRRWLVRVDSTTGHDEPIVPEFIDGPGHPTQSPDGRWIATDEFPPDGETSPIRVFDLRTGQGRRIVRLPHRFYPALIDTATYWRAQELMKSRRGVRLGVYERKRQEPHLLSGLLQCGCCGRNMLWNRPVNGAFHARCIWACKSRPFRMRETAWLEWAESFFATGFKVDQEAKPNPERALFLTKLDKITTNISAMETKFAKGDLGADLFTKAMDMARAERDKVQREIEALPPAQTAPATPWAEMSFDEKRQAMLCHVESIVVMPDHVVVHYPPWRTRQPQTFPLMLRRGKGSKVKLSHALTPRRLTVTEAVQVEAGNTVNWTPYIVEGRFYHAKGRDKVERKVGVTPLISLVGSLAREQQMRQGDYRR